MKRFLIFILVLTLLVVTGTFVSANSQTRRNRSQLPAMGAARNNNLFRTTNGGK